MATFTELTGLPIETDEPAVRPLDTQHGTGAAERLAAGNAAVELDESTNFGDTLGSAWERGITPMFYDDVQRKLSHEPEEGFKADAWVEENADTLPGTNLEKFADVRSTAEADELRADMLRAQDNDAQLQAKGASGVAAQLLTGFVDPAELVIGFATGGSGKALTVAGRVGKIVQAGAVGGVTSGGVAYAVDPLADAKQVVMAGLSGALVAGSIGTAANVATRKAGTGYAAAVDDLEPADWDHVEPPVWGMTESPQSLGAGSLSSEPLDLTDVSPTSQSIIDQSMATIRENGLGTRMDDTDMNTDTALGRTAKRMSDALAEQLPDVMKVDFDRLMYGGSRVEAALSYNLLESPEGRVRNNRSAAMLKETYEQRMSSRSLPVLDEQFSGWASSKQMGVIDRNKIGARAAFDREIILELEARYHEGKPVSTNKHIAAAANGIDENMAEALTIGKGRDGETSVDGFDTIQQKSGFFPHRWDGAAMRKLIANGTNKAKIIALLDKGYAKSHPNMDDAQRAMVSKAVVRRAMAREDGVDSNMLSTLDSDGQEYLRATLQDSGYGDADIDGLIDSLRGKREEQGQLGTTKARVQVDLRTTDGDLSLVDLIDNNATRVLTRYNREVSGNSALARKGISNRANRKEIIEAAMAERRSRGLAADESNRTFLENVFTYFDSGPIGGGVDPLAMRAKRVTNLVLLNQMGLAQLGEVGAQMAAVGMKTWSKHARVITKEMLAQGPEGPLVKELRPLMGEIGKEHLLFRDDLAMDELATTKDMHTFTASLDAGLGKAQRLQGYISGFYHIRQFQQRVAVSAMADKTMQRVRDGVDTAELTSLGVNPAAMAKYVKNGAVEFDADGFVNKLNMDQWDAVDAEDFALSLNRGTHQVVQKAMAGEETMWMHTTVGSLMTHLRSFPITALRKQSIRTSGISTPLMTATLLMGLATAGLAQQAKQVINGKGLETDPAMMLKRAAGMSNMTGWVPMLTDPAAAMLGMNDLRFSQYGRHDLNSGVIPTPPTLPTLNKVAKLPGAVNPFGDLSANERIRLMQSLPLVGNAYGFSALFNSMKD